MVNAIKSFQPAYKNILGDKINIMLAMIPVILGVILYAFVGRWAITEALDYGQKFIEGYLSEGAAGQIVYYIVAGILSVMLYFIVSWTFILLLSLIASPFNDILSMRIEKRILGEDLPSFKKSFSMISGNFFTTIFNEFKKIVFILTLSSLAFLMAYIPLLIPVSALAAALLLAVEFVDFSWSRNKMSSRDCINDLKKNIINYIVGGGFFLLLVALPVVNLIVPSLATSYFTILWLKNNKA